MEEKLIKNRNAYSLKINGEYVAFANEDFVGYATQEFRDNLLGTLSLSNCQAIANDYDLDELADFYGAKAKGSVDFKLGANQGFEDGFKQALEILGDKKFSEKDMKNAIQRARNDYNGNIIESLQQTEWEVEIVMETCSMNPSDLDCSEIVERPKLDADRCLILKRK